MKTRYWIRLLLVLAAGLVVFLKTRPDNKIPDGNYEIDSVDMTTMLYTIRSRDTGKTYEKVQMPYRGMAYKKGEQFGFVTGKP